MTQNNLCELGYAKNSWQLLISILNLCANPFNFDKNPSKWINQRLIFCINPAVTKIFNENFVKASNYGKFNKPQIYKIHLIVYLRSQFYKKGKGE